MDTNLSYDQRQYKLMDETISLYLDRKITLGKLITNLEGLLGALADVNPEWRDDFLRKWGILEDVYADALDQQIQLDEDDHHLISNALAGLKSQIQPMLEQRISVK